jgi:hypothetical protein
MGVTVSHTHRRTGVLGVLNIMVLSRMLGPLREEEKQDTEMTYRELHGSSSLYAIKVIMLGRTRLKTCRINKVDTKFL